MLRVVIVEDELKEAERLQSFLKRFEAENGIVFEIEIYSSALTFLANYKQDTDLVLMDIELPDVNGMEICRRLRKTDNRVAIIFVTNMARFAVNGYEVDALDFIVKPARYGEFAVKVKKAVEIIRKNMDNYLVLSGKGFFKRLNVNELFYVEVMACRTMRCAGRSFKFAVFYSVRHENKSALFLCALSSRRPPELFRRPPR